MPGCPKNDRKRIHRRRFAVALVFVLLLALLFSNACTSTITPPKQVENPVVVFLLKEARHTGLVLPDKNGGFVEFGYGDWDWFALMCNKWYHVFDTVLWPTQGCLGRRIMVGKNQLPHKPNVEMYPLKVEAVKAAFLADQLNQQFDTRIETLHRNEMYDFDFVHCDDDFWLFYNCHDSIAEWLEMLDCNISWRPVRLEIVTEQQ